MGRSNEEIPAPFLICAALLSSPAAAQTACMKHDILVQMLDGRYSEHPVSRGLEAGGRMMEVFATVDDTAEFISLGSGNWLCLWYKRASGAPVSVGVVDSQAFSASGSWNKPVLGSFAAIEVWGGGGGGGDAYNGNITAAGGAGGDYAAVLMHLSELAASETVTIAAGGAGASGSQGAGLPDGTTTLGSEVGATGGSGGDGQSGIGTIVAPWNSFSAPYKYLSVFSEEGEAHPAKYVNGASYQFAGGSGAGSINASSSRIGGDCVVLGTSGGDWSLGVDSDGGTACGGSGSTSGTLPSGAGGSGYCRVTVYA